MSPSWHDLAKQGGLEKSVCWMLLPSRQTTRALPSWPGPNAELSQTGPCGNAFFMVDLCWKALTSWNCQLLSSFEHHRRIPMVICILESMLKNNQGFLKRQIWQVGFSFYLSSLQPITENFVSSSKPCLPGVSLTKWQGSSSSLLPNKPQNTYSSLIFPSAPKSIPNPLVRTLCYKSFRAPLLLISSLLAIILARCHNELL